MDVRQDFLDAYNGLPPGDVVVPGLRLDTESHRQIMHQANRGCTACVGEIVDLVIKDALRAGVLMATAVQAVLDALREQGYGTREALRMVRGLKPPGMGHGPSYKRKRRVA